MKQRHGDLEQQLEEIRRVPGVAAALDRLATEGARVTWVRQQEDLVAVRVQTPDRLQVRFGLAPELLFLLCRGHLQARHTRGGIPSTVRSDRTDPGLAFWSDPHPELADRLATLPTPAGLWLPWQPDSPALEVVLAGRLGAHDAFDVIQPVRGRDRVGRDGLVATLARELVRHGAVGVYGLRKVGKTSVALGLKDMFAEDAQRPVAYADAQTYIGDGPHAEQALLKHLMNALKLVGTPSVGALRAGLSELIEAGRSPTVIIDEFDWLLSESVYKPLTLPLLAMIRGLVQTCPGRVGWVLVGREPARLDGPRIAGRPNPTLNFWRPMWVGPLSDRDLGTLLRRLGKRMGLELGHVSKQRAFDLTGGHPHLARVFGGVLARITLAGGPAPQEQNRPTDPFVEEATSVFLRSQDVKNWVEEVGDLLHAHHPEAARLLLAQLDGPDARVWQERAIRSPEAAELLRDFGLVDEGGKVPAVLGHHRRRLQRLAAA